MTYTVNLMISRGLPRGVSFLCALCIINCFINFTVLHSFVPMKYILDTKRFLRLLHEQGFQNLLDFAKKSGIHRNTLTHMCGGRSILTTAFQAVANQLHVDPQMLMLPTSTRPSELPIDEIRPVVARIIQKDPKVAVVLFGSRAGGKPARYSDWDLGIIRFPEALSGIEFLHLKRCADETSEDLVRHVDVVNLHQAPADFLANMVQQVHFLDGNPEGWVYLRGVLDAIQRTEEAA